MKKRLILVWVRPGIAALLEPVTDNKEDLQYPYPVSSPVEAVTCRDF